MDSTKIMSLDLTIRARENVLYQGVVSSFTSYNDKGRFDVLAGHANFISLINKSLRYRDLNNGVHDLNIGTGIMRVIIDKVEVYLGVEGLKEISKNM